MIEPRREYVEYVVDLFYKKNAKLPEDTWCRVHGLHFQSIESAKEYADKCKDGYVYGIRIVELRTVSNIVHEELSQLAVEGKSR